MSIAKHYDNRWLAMGLLCMGALMIVLDVTIVNVALPSIRTDLRFDDVSLAWVVNAYVLIFGGFLLLGGRLGDLYGHRKIFLAGLALFTLASLACGVAGSQSFLIVARSVQGLGGAIVDAVSLSLIMNLFTGTHDRTKAMGVYGFVCSGGGCIGALLGGVLTGGFNWHWIFLVNVPVGIAVFALCWKLLPRHAGEAEGRQHLDVGGAVTVTLALLLATYATINGNQAGWTSLRTLGIMAVSLVVFGAFLVIEAKVKKPLVPLAMLRLRNLSVASMSGILWAAAMFAWFFLSALYMQLVLGFTPMQIGMAFLPSNLVMAVMSLGFSAKLVMRFGIKGPMFTGLLIASLGLLLFARAPVDGTLVRDVLPGMMLLGLGAGIAFNPVLMAAMNGVPETESGLASGIVNTAFMLGGALGLAVLASVAEARTGSLLGAGTAHAEALAGGYQAAFLCGAAFALLSGLLGVTFLRTSQPSAPATAH
ncbi:MAG TPA: DHA2 family efflux MFS transporter permease subunit [Gammaproteobacteria bacterium]|jgi:EmrB/QacA subfamily drug resistance transporter|nr:DHA2 family efflux MFS transporter permease subunit [Gammaproteobacteria bacterium]